MKKLCFLLLVMILMTACSTPAQNSQTGSGDENCLHVNVYRTVSEYEEYLSSKRLPSNFVHLDNIPNFGSFKRFIPVTFKFPNEYKYGFIGSDNWEVDLYITHDAKKEQYPELSVTSDMTDMRKTSCKAYSVIKRNGVEYHYGQSGYLMNIVWYDGNTQFKLGGHLTKTSNSIVNRLLSISETEAAAAFAEIKQSLDARK